MKEDNITSMFWLAHKVTFKVTDSGRKTSYGAYVRQIFRVTNISVSPCEYNMTVSLWQQSACVMLPPIPRRTSWLYMSTPHTVHLPEASLHVSWCCCVCMTDDIGELSHWQLEPLLMSLHTHAHTHKHAHTPFHVANVITDTSLRAILIISQQFFTLPGAESSREDNHKVMNIYNSD